MVPKLKRTLYIGLGGTGFKTLLHTKRAFIETYGEVPPMIKFLAFDSDQNQYKNYVLPSIYGDVKFDPSESSDIMVNQARDKVSRNRTQLSWLPDRNMQAVQDLANGCGMVRTNGRIVRDYHFSGGGLLMSREGNFLVFCTEQYKSAKGLTGIQISQLFTKYKVWDYIYSCFEALHTTGEKYIVEDIDSYIEERKITAV